MTKVSNYLMYKTIRLGKTLSLIFFALALMPACHSDEQDNITIVWTNKQATSIVIPRSLIREVDLPADLQVRLSTGTTNILGEYQIQKGNIVFQPVIPFSRGARYEVFIKKKLIGRVEVPADSTATSPGLLAVYPSSDSVPENLLKLYLEFSAPMREGQALEHVSLLNDKSDTLPGIFLDLQPELWNKERTVLTLWLDPGRIKRGLIPNTKKGNPLQKGQRYTLVVSGKWKDVQGLALQQTYKRNLIVGSWDSISPRIQLWSMVLPEAGTLQPLRVFAGEPLDYFLLSETIRIFDEKNSPLDGLVTVTDNEKSFLFTPRKQWQPGRYRMQVAPRLEDLAGNNLERLFDRDMLAPPSSADENIKEREFSIAGKK